MSARLKELNEELQKVDKESKINHDVVEKYEKLIAKAKNKLQYTKEKYTNLDPWRVWPYQEFCLYWLVLEHFDH